MGGSGENFFYLLDDKKIAALCAFDKNYAPFRGGILEKNIFEKVGILGIKKCIFMDQIHSKLIEIYDEKITTLPPCDGLITTEKNVALCVLSADCLPLLLWHEDGLVAALHAGRAGCYENILENCLKKIIKIRPGLNQKLFHLFIGPGICQDHYELGEESLEYAKKYFKECLNGQKLDLKKIIKIQAKELGIQNIMDCGICNFEKAKLPSFRRDKTGERFVSAIFLKG